MDFFYTRIETVEDDEYQSLYLKIWAVSKQDALQLIKYKFTDFEFIQFELKYFHTKGIPKEKFPPKLFTGIMSREYLNKYLKIKHQISVGHLTPFETIVFGSIPQSLHSEMLAIQEIEQQQKKLKVAWEKKSDALIKFIEKSIKMWPFKGLKDGHNHLKINEEKGFNFFYNIKTKEVESYELVDTISLEKFND